MKNNIYIPKELEETFQGLSRDEKKMVIRTIDSLEEDALGNSRFVSSSSPARGVVREAQAGNLRVLFNYTADNHSVIVTRVFSAAEGLEMAATA